MFARFVILFFCLSTTVQAYDASARGTELRKDILNATRVALAMDLGAPLEFVVDDIRYAQNVAHVRVHPQRPGGVPIVWDDTPLGRRGDQLDHYDGLTTWVFLHRKAGHWYVFSYYVGPTDVAWGPAECPAFKAVIPVMCDAIAKY